MNIETSFDSFDEKFIQYFVNFICKKHCHSAISLEKSLMTAALTPQSSYPNSNDNKSLLFQSINHSCNKYEREQYLETDDKMLSLYLNNLDRIKSALLQKIGNNIDYIDVIERSFTSLENIKNANPTISTGKIIYDEREGHISKVVRIYNDGTYYNGEEVGGIPNGKGRIISKDALIYEGEIVGGKKHGKGKVISLNKSTYEGDFIDDKIHGKGKQTKPDGTRYEGDFFQGKKHGKGTIIVPDKFAYRGDFLHGRQSGKGILILPDKTTYEGDF